MHSQPVGDAAEVVRFFEQHNLAPLIQTVSGRPDDYSINGFRGPDRYRTEVVITKARKSPQNPFAYLVEGMTRTKRRIKPFEGRIVFDSLAIESLLTAEDERNIKNWSMINVIRPDKTLKRYSAAGQVRLYENKAAWHASSFEGAW